MTQVDFEAVEICNSTIEAKILEHYEGKILKL